MSKDDVRFLALVISVIGGIILACWALVALLVGINAVLGKENFCEWKNGVVQGTPSNNRWEPNPLTMGLTGKCYVPGTKGVTN